MDFQGMTKVFPTPQEPQCFTDPVIPISRQADSRDGGPYKEKITLPGTSATVSMLARVTARAPEEAYLHSKLRNIYLIPFRIKGKKT